MLEKQSLYSVSILTSEWEPIRETINVLFIPRVHELIYLEQEASYFRVLQVIHYLTLKQGIFLIVEKEDENKIKKLDKYEKF